MIEIYCQHCGQRMEIPDQYAGTTGTCKKCGNPIAVPASGPQSASKPTPQQQSAFVPLPAARARLNFPLKTVGIGAGAVVLVALLAVGLLGLFSRPGSPANERTASRASLRTVTFPSDRAVGMLFLRNVGEEGWGIGRRDGARGLITVPEGKEVGLGIFRQHSADLAFLKTFAANDLDFLLLEHPSVTNRHLANIEHLTGLDFLLVEYNEVTDAGLRSLRPLVNLKFLGLGGTKITDAGLSTLTFLHRLEGLSLGGTRITDRGIRSLSSLPLKIVMLNGIALTRPMVDALKEFPRLTSLRIDSGRPSDETRILGGDRPTRLDSILLLGEITQLRTLVLNGKLHDDSLIPALSQLTGLKKIKFEETSVTPAGRNELRRAIPNCEVIP